MRTASGCDRAVRPAARPLNARRGNVWQHAAVAVSKARSVFVSIPAFAGAVAAAAAIACAGTARAASADGESDVQPADPVVRVVFETERGDVEIGVEPARAPISAANFLAYVDAGHYDGATIYRAAQKSGPDTIGILQGGLLAAAMSGDGAYLDRATPPLPPVAHETTRVTGIPNERGTIALARMEPGTAASEFFFNMSDNPELDTDANVPGRDGFGYATFGRVLGGIDVLDAIQRLPADGKTTIERVKGQVLSEPVVIRRAYRVP